MHSVPNSGKHSFGTKGGGNAQLVRKHALRAKRGIKKIKLLLSVGKHKNRDKRGVCACALDWLKKTYSLWFSTNFSQKLKWSLLTIQSGLATFLGCKKNAKQRN